MFDFNIEPTGGVHDFGTGFNNTTGRTDQRVINEITKEDPRLFADEWKQEDWTLDLEMPGASTGDVHGPNYNFILTGSDDGEYATMLAEWLADLDTQAMVPTPHHEAPEKIAPQPSVSPANAPSYWPAGHEPDWAKAASDGLRTPHDKDPDDETTEGGWLNNLTDKIIEREITPGEYDEGLDHHEAEAQRPSRGHWLRRLLRR